MQPRALLLALAAFVFAASPSLAKKKESVVYSFGITSADAKSPQDGLVADKAGNLYGTSIQGGLKGNGAVFVAGRNGVETVIYSFRGGKHDGAEPNAGVTMDKKGDLFGTTMMGGPAGKGVVFELVPNGQSYTEKVLYQFCSAANCADGDTPAAGVTIASNGVLYGTTQLGGVSTNGQINGVVWRLDPPSKSLSKWTEKVLYNFCSQASCADGRVPYTRPISGKDGFLYGTAALSQLGGTLYRVSKAGGSFQVLHTFGLDSGDGASPISMLNADSKGVLYGTTRQGGAHGCGTVYSFDPASFVYNKLYDFCSVAADGSTPYAGVAIAGTNKNRVLYGATISAGTHGGGTLYALRPPAVAGQPWTEQTLHNFCAETNCADGDAPGFGSPLQVDGIFYGTTTGGGAFGGGVLYKLAKP